MKFKRNFIAALLMLLILTVQQSVVAHTVSHWNYIDHDRQEQQLPHDETCDRCFVFAQFSSLLTADFSIPISDIAAYPQKSCEMPQAIVAQSFRFYQTRAPPSFCIYLSEKA